ncbi:MAG: hypothetical protein QGG40_01765, partial [Myxococcota bacterium]|nr:hypothetical protein [Myxococcota bacterium]
MSLPRWLVGLLVSGLVLTLLAVAFLVGRVTAPTPRTALSPLPPPTADLLEAARGATQHTGLPEGALGELDPFLETLDRLDEAMLSSSSPALPSDPPPSSGSGSEWERLWERAAATQSGGQAPPTTTGDAGTGPRTAAPGGTASASQVRRYLQAMEYASSTGKYWDDAHGQAQVVVAQIIKGDSSEMDNLANSYRSVMERIRAIDAPPGCGAHQEATLAVLEETVRTLEGYSRATKNQDLDAVVGLASQSNGLREK